MGSCSRVHKEARSVAPTSAGTPDSPRWRHRSRNLCGSTTSDTHADMLIAQGEHPKVIQLRLGHSSIQVTLNTYGHLFEGLDEAAAERLHVAFLRTPAESSRTPPPPKALGLFSLICRIPSHSEGFLWSGWPDLNRRPLDPQLRLGVFGTSIRP